MRGLLATEDGTSWSLVYDYFHYCKKSSLLLPQVANKNAKELIEQEKKEKEKLQRKEMKKQVRFKFCKFNFPVGDSTKNLEVKI